MQTMLVAPQKESCRNAALFFVPPSPFPSHYNLRGRCKTDPMQKSLPKMSRLRAGLKSSQMPNPVSTGF